MKKKTKYIIFLSVISVIAILMGLLFTKGFLTKDESMVKPYLQDLQMSMKDPSSLQLYGDCYYTEYEDIKVIEIYYNAKNSYGAYNGVEGIDYVINNQGTVMTFTTDDELFSYISKCYNRKDCDIEVKKIGLKRLARILDVEYVEEN